MVSQQEPGVREDGFADRGREVTRHQSFLDASFAFTLTVLVIAGAEVPDSIPKLQSALKLVPTFAASFLMVIVFWSGHEVWTRRYGLDDRRSRQLGLLLIFLVLVYVYPLKMLFGALFAWLSSGFLPARFVIENIGELRAVYYAYALAFGTLGGVMALLYRHAWQLRDRLALSAFERRATCREVVRWSLLPAFAALSMLLAWALPEQPNGWQIGLPGAVYFALHGCTRYLRYLSARDHLAETPPP
ncbi:TMEM175 family protein [Tahibacter caeni]|uniref:TMEM175 family protein n=1 Tax=Tahibacter caeni TaxID=1453545 RepID=UPI002147F7DA|nr:TMEM175 family protein [Tahibacter caeni]